MELLNGLVELILNIDKYLTQIVQIYGTWTYLILFLIIFCETGLVVTPFLPGDSLLFVIGALGASGILNFKLAVILLAVSALAGNTLNYFFGRMIGHKALSLKNSRIIKKEYLDRTYAFYEKHGGKAIVLSRFLPIIRTFAPFVAGIGKMNFIKFFIYNSIGGVAWVLTFVFGGYFFGNIPLIKNNFTYVILSIIFISFIPALVTYIKNKKSGIAQNSI